MSMLFSFLSLLAFCYFITSTSCISQALSTFSLSPPCLSLWCLLFAPHFSLSFQENITSTMVTHHKKIRTTREITVQHLEERHYPGTVAFYGSRSLSQGCLLTLQAPQWRQISGCAWAFSADKLQSLCKAVSFQSSPGRDADAIKMLSQKTCLKDGLPPETLE